MMTIRSVLPDRDFVQMPGVAQNKFRSSVACRLHIRHREDPKREQPEVKPPPRHKHATHKNHLPLTEINSTRFNPPKSGGATRWLMMQT
jgi:hypothetical protein